jgi:hypothetical protein
VSGLHPDYKADLIGYHVSGRVCTCNHPNAHPPCSTCTHPGHPFGLEVPENWIDMDCFDVLKITLDHAMKFAPSKGFDLDPRSVEGFYSAAWRVPGEGRVLRYYFEPETERALFSAAAPGFHTAAYDTIEAAYVAAELAQWGGYESPRETVYDRAVYIFRPLLGIELSNKHRREDVARAVSTLLIRDEDVSRTLVDLIHARCRSDVPERRLDDAIDKLRGRR